VRKIDERTKEEFYESCLRNRQLVKDPEVMRCVCPDTLCEWHGKCKECVALHRYKKDHIPHCLHPILNDKVKALAYALEMYAEKREGTPVEYRHYMRERDASGG
jgi:hypothetical protein